MGLNNTPSANRVQIAFFGRRNAGKSSVVNAVTGQELSVVSPVAGTTTDPVYKAMELLPLGPVTIIDTPGIDDEGELGALRVEKAGQVLRKTDVALLVVDAARGKTQADEELLRLFREKNISHLVVYNKSDLLPELPPLQPGERYVSALEQRGIEELKEKIAALAPTEQTQRRIVGDLISPGDFVVLVVCMDESAPKGRLILPQQQTIRDILDAGGAAITVRGSELRQTLKSLGKRPRLVITDSQIFEQASADTPAQIPLTSFSILFARYKGLLDAAVRGAAMLEKLKDGDTILIAEGCTHHRQCNDIGAVKLPRWIKNHTGKQLNFAFASGGDFPEQLSPYALIVHCGGCMLNGREVAYRQKQAAAQQVPITNYGVLIAYMQGILRRSLEVFPHLLEETGL